MGRARTLTAYPARINAYITYATSRENPAISSNIVHQPAASSPKPRLLIRNPSTCPSVDSILGGASRLSQQPLKLVSSFQSLGEHRIGRANHRHAQQQQQQPARRHVSSSSGRRNCHRRVSPSILQTVHVACLLTVLLSIVLARASSAWTLLLCWLSGDLAPTSPSLQSICRETQLLPIRRLGEFLFFCMSFLAFSPLTISFPVQGCWGRG